MRTSADLTTLAMVLARTSGLQAASTIQFSAITDSVTEGASQVEVAVQRTDALDTVVSVDFNTAQLAAIPESITWKSPRT